MTAVFIRREAVLLVLAYMVFAYRRVQDLTEPVSRDKATVTQEHRLRRSRTFLEKTDDDLETLIDCGCDQVSGDLATIENWPPGSWWSQVRMRGNAYFAGTCQDESGKDGSKQDKEMETILEGLRLRVNQITLSKSSVEKLIELLRQSP